MVLGSGFVFGGEGKGGGYDDSVVMIRSVSQGYDYVTPWKQTAMSQGVGTGFVIAGNRILTNAHNVSNYRYIELKKVGVAKRYPAKVAFVGHDCDLAVITPDDESFFEGTIPLELAGLPEVNTTVSTYGFPLGGTDISVTEGVVSRIQMDSYSHSGADSHLVIQTDAAINPGNSGGPVLQGGKVVGVAFQGLMQADNIGYLIPTTVIEHFLKDIEDGKYDGFGSMGVALYPGLHSESYKDYLKVPADEDGVVVIETMMHSSVEDLLRPGDVITKVGEYDVDNDGMVRIYGLNLDMSEVVEAKQIGDKIDVTIYRDGEKKEVTATVALNRPILEYARKYDEAPPHVCFAGLVFTPVTRNYLEMWGSDWPTDIPFYLRYLFHNSMQLNTDRERKEYVVMSEVLADEVNAYAGGFKSEVVVSVNGVEIRSLGDLNKALNGGREDFYVFEFMGDTRVLSIDGPTARRRQEGILQDYGVPAAARLEGQL